MKLFALFVAATSLATISSVVLAQTDQVSLGTAQQITLTQYHPTSLASLIAPAVGKIGKAEGDDDYGPHKGSKTIAAEGSLTFFPGGSDFGFVEAQLSVYLSQAFELVLETTLDFTSGSGGGTNTSGAFGVLGRYNFGTGRTRPYVLLGFDQQISSGGGSTSSGYQIGFGANFFIRPQQSFFLEYAHESFSGQDDDKLGFGLRFFFR